MSEELSVPAKLNGKKFEKLLLEYTVREKKRLTMDRYGVQVAFIDGAWTPVPSFPDFEGVIMGGKQFIVEAKSCSAASFPLHDDKFKERQYRHMKRRSKYGVPCFLIVHFNQRILKTKTVPAMTISIRVDPGMQLWKDFEAGLVKSISPELALENGSVVEWKTPKGCRKALPAFI